MNKTIADCGLRIADCKFQEERKVDEGIDKFNPQSAIRNPQSGLPAWERKGYLDLALGAVLLLQGWLMPVPPCIERKFIELESPRQVALLGLLPLATWLILATGALAPLLRRRVARPGELPRGAGLWLAAYALMAASWFVILNNVNPDALWGFWHLAHLTRGEATLFALAVPAALAPGWRRLVRALRLATLRKARSAERGARRGRSRPLLFPLFLGAYAWLLTDYAIMSDGFGIIQFAHDSRALEPDQYREPGTLLLLKGAAHALRPMGLDAAQTVHLVNFLALLATLGLLGWMLRRMELNRRQRTAGWWLVFSSLGITQLLLGRVELYPLVQLSLTATLAAALALLHGSASPAWLALTFALGLFGHLSLIFILPAVLLALWLWARPHQCAGTPATLRPPSLARAAAHLLGWGALVHLPLWGWLMLKLADPTPRGLVHAVLGSLNTGAVGKVEKAMGLTTLAGKLARIFTLDNEFKLVQIIFYLAGGALLTVLLAALGRIRHNWRMVGRPAPAWSREMALFAAAFAGYLLYAFTWPNDWTWTEDWDLFSGIAPLAVLVAARWLMPAPGAWRLPPALLRRVCLFALALGLIQHYYNHVNASFLGSMGKINQSREEGRLIQQYQIEHGWLRGHEYTIVGGKVVETILPSYATTPAAPTGAKP